MLPEMPWSLQPQRADELHEKKEKKKKTKKLIMLSLGKVGQQLFAEAYNEKLEALQLQLHTHRYIGLSRNS